MLPVIRKKGFDMLDTFWDNFWLTGNEINACFPKVDIHEDTHNIYIDADLPGLDKKDIAVNLQNNTLRLSGSREHKSEEKKKGYHRIEREYGQFEREFYLGDTIDPSKVKAEFEKGVLRITVAKKEEAKPKAVDIEVK